MKKICKHKDYEEEKPPIVENDLEKIEKSRITDAYLLSPIDINYNNCTLLKLPDLQWTNYDYLPERYQVTNNGKTVILSGKWSLCNQPYLTNGPLNGKYILSKIIFYWGKKANCGSIHSFDGKRQALEVHSVHFRDEYKNDKNAMKHQNGIVIVVYLFEIRFCINVGIEAITSSLKNLKAHNSSIYIEAFKLCQMLPIVNQDYFTYFGVMKSCEDNCGHLVQWIIPRKILPVSFYQMKQFSPLFSSKLLTIERIWRRIVDEQQKSQLFLVSQKFNYEINSTWLPSSPAIRNTV